MEYRRLGNSGTRVSVLSLGGWTTFGGSVKDQETANDIIRRAYDAGINFFDIADVYARGASEQMMGKVLAEFPRHTLVISSKLFWPMSDDVNDRGLSRKHIMESIDKSLQRIGTDYLDIYFCHRYDEDTSLEETIRAMDDLIHRGKILYWGTSEWTAEQIQNAVDICEKYNLYKPQVEQPQYNLVVRDTVENEIIPVAQRNSMGLVIWSPLASGILTGKYDSGIPEDSRLGQIDWLREDLLEGENNPIEQVRAMKRIADDLNVTRAQLALAWTIQRQAVTSAITGATKRSQLEDNLQAATLELDNDVMAQLDRIFA
ncbi:MAG: aldo/keto reductase family protein [Chloroflexi bacterium]|nr:aldo/keto reductase family protein [Chloroflexota bacterium]